MQKARFQDFEIRPFGILRHRRPPLAQVVTNEYFGSMILLDKKGFYVGYIIHFLLLPKIIVNKKIATAGDIMRKCFTLGEMSDIR